MSGASLYQALMEITHALDCLSEVLPPVEKSYLNRKIKAIEAIAESLFPQENEN